MEGVGVPTCADCNRDIAGIKDVVAKGYYISSGRITIDSTKIVRGHFTVKSDYVVEVFINQDPLVVTSKTTHVAHTNEPAVKNFAQLVFVSWISGKWLIVDVGQPS